ARKQPRARVQSEPNRSEERGHPRVVLTEPRDQREHDREERADGRDREQAPRTLETARSAESEPDARRAEGHRPRTGEQQVHVLVCGPVLGEEPEVEEHPADEAEQQADERRQRAERRAKRRARAGRAAQERERAAEREPGEREARNARGRRVERGRSLRGDEGARAGHYRAPLAVAVDRRAVEGAPQLVWNPELVPARRRAIGERAEREVERGVEPELLRGEALGVLAEGVAARALDGASELAAEDAIDRVADARRAVVVVVVVVVVAVFGARVLGEGLRERTAL